jgi:hypothetical protein
MPEISEITLPSGTTYDIKDGQARSAKGWIGITTTALTDGSTTNPIAIGGQSVTATAGDITAYGDSEFIWNGSEWQEFGNLEDLGALAYKDSASGSFTPQGSNASSSVSGSCSVTPSGTISTGTGTANYTPAGSVTVTPSTATKYVASSATGGGSVTAGTACTMPTFTVSNEVLTITAGKANTPTAVTLPSFSSQTIATGISSASFSGTGAELKFTGSSSSGTISGTAAAQTFTGTAGIVTVS